MVFLPEDEGMCFTKLGNSHNSWLYETVVTQSVVSGQSITSHSLIIWGEFPKSRKISSGQLVGNRQTMIFTPKMIWCCVGKLTREGLGRYLSFCYTYHRLSFQSSWLYYVGYVIILRPLYSLGLITEISVSHNRLLSGHWNAYVHWTAYHLTCVDVWVSIVRHIIALWGFSQVHHMIHTQSFKQ